MSIHLQKSYDRTPEFEALAREAQLQFVEWSIVFALDGLKTGAEIALAFKLSEGRADEIFERLVAKGIIGEYNMGVEDYLQRRQIMALNALAESAGDGRANSTTNGSRVRGQRLEPDFPMVGSLSATISRLRSPKSTVDGTNGKTQVPAASTNGNGNAPKKNRFRLKAATDFIQGHAGGGTLGQLAVYRALMLVPSDLLRETGLRRLDFNDETIEIESPKLRQAIVDAIGKTLQVELPVEYFLE